MLHQAELAVKLVLRVFRSVHVLIVWVMKLMLYGQFVLCGDQAALEAQVAASQQRMEQELVSSLVCYG